MFILATVIVLIGLWLVIQLVWYAITHLKETAGMFLIMLWVSSLIVTIVCIWGFVAGEDQRAVLAGIPFVVFFVLGLVYIVWSIKHPKYN